MIVSADTTAHWGAYRVYDVQACKLRDDVVLVDDVKQVFVTATGEVVASRVIIMPDEHRIIINATADSQYSYAAACEHDRRQPGEPN